MDKPMALPRRENAMIGFRPARSEIWGHRKSPKSIPRGYADVSAPKLGPTSRLKWVPSSGVMGPAMVLGAFTATKEAVASGFSTSWKDSFRENSKEACNAVSPVGGYLLKTHVLG